MTQFLTQDIAFLLDPSVWIRIAVSILCGAAIGFERESHSKPAGMRTTMLISVGAAIYAMIGIEIGRRLEPHIDPTRIAAQIVTGVGFIGAGVIIHVGATVKGLTTAAAIWVTAAVGTMIGLGYPLTAFVITVCIILILVILDRFERRFFPVMRADNASKDS